MKIKCPACSKLLSIPDSAAGKVVKCPCGKQIKAPAAAPARNPAPASGGPAARRAPTGRATGSPAPARHPGGNSLDPGMFDELTEQDLNPDSSMAKQAAPAATGNTAKLLQEHAATAGGRSGTQFRRGPIASRGSRLLGAILDGIFITMMSLPVLIACKIILVPALLPNFVDPEVLANLENLENLSEEELSATAAGLMPGLSLAYAISLVIACAFPVILYAIMVTKSGQTLGKKCVGIRILDSNTGQLPGFVKGVLVRGWLIVLLYGIPAFALIDILMIFRKGNRCLHDDIAGTMVVQA